MTNQPMDSLFSRIMIRLCIPLFVLASLLTSLQLTNQMRILNNQYRLESREAFKEIQTTLMEEAKKLNFAEALTETREKLSTLTHFYRVDAINLYNLFERKPVFSEEASIWTEADSKAMEEALHQKQQGKSFHIMINKEAKQLVGYLPIEGIDNSQLFIARVIFSLPNIKFALKSSRSILGIIFIFIALAGAVIAQSLSKIIVKPLRTLSQAAAEISKGELGKHVGIKTGDEIEILANTFNQMSDTLKEMKQRAEDANPLTGLPGNQAIFHDLQKRIYEKQKFVFFHVDLDRFKVFNDHFGLAKGDEAIQRTAELLRKVAIEKGAQDFIGHQGGDDFVVITRPSRGKELAEHICKRFDEEVVRLIYPKDDYERGYIETFDRRRLTETGEKLLVKFPLLAISLAGVTNTKKDFADYFDCMNALPPVKKKVKETIESSYIIEE